MDKTMYLHYLIFLFIIFASAKSSNAYRVRAETIRGEYGGRSILRCSIIHANMSISFIEWHDTTLHGDSVCFVDALLPPPSNKIRGNCKGRNITGYFGNNGSYHQMIIENSTLEAHGPYTCHVEVDSSPIWEMAETNLTLVAVADEPPAIMDILGDFNSSYDCSNIQRIPIQTPKFMSLICGIGGSNPYPSVKWYYKGHCVEHPEEGDLQRRGEMLVQKKKRRIDILSLDYPVLKCIILLPDPWTGKLKEKHLCLPVLSIDTAIDARLYFGLFGSYAIVFTIELLRLIRLEARLRKKPPCTGLGHWMRRLRTALLWKWTVLTSLVLVCELSKCYRVLNNYDYDNHLPFQILHIGSGIYLIIRMVSSLVLFKVVATSVNMCKTWLVKYAVHTISNKDVIFLIFAMPVFPLLLWIRCHCTSLQALGDSKVALPENDTSDCTIPDDANSDCSDTEDDGSDEIVKQLVKLLVFSDIIESGLCWGGIVWSFTSGPCSQYQGTEVYFFTVLLFACMLPFIMFVCGFIIKRVILGGHYVVTDSGVYVIYKKKGDQDRVSVPNKSNGGSTVSSNHETALEDDDKADTATLSTELDEQECEVVIKMGARLPESMDIKPEAMLADIHNCGTNEDEQPNQTENKELISLSNHASVFEMMIQKARTQAAALRKQLQHLVCRREEEKDASLMNAWAIESYMANMERYAKILNESKPK